MKKITVLALAIIMIAALLASCTGGAQTDTDKTTDTANAVKQTEATKTETKETDPDAIAKKLVEEGDFEGELEQIQGIEYVYSDLPAGVEAAVYQSTAYSDEVAVFKTNDTAAVRSVVEAYVEARVATFKDYAPAQSAKADENAAIVTGDGVVVLVISNASAADAEALIKKALG